MGTRLGLRMCAPSSARMGCSRHRPVGQTDATSRRDEASAGA
jgi:hypothetical protein